MASNTKERILETALNMFSEKGYEGTNMREIAEALGLVKSSLYKHFESKEVLWNKLIDKMCEYYSERFGTVDKLPRVPQNTDELREMTLGMINFTIHDESVRKMRRILHTEQFRDERVKEMAERYFLKDTEAIFTKVFEEMTANGSLKKIDPQMLAFVYTTPITAIIHLCDREPEMIDEAMGKIEAFIEHFIGIYGN